MQIKDYINLAIINRLWLDFLLPDCVYGYVRENGGNATDNMSFSLRSCSCNKISLARGSISD